MENMNIYEKLSHIQNEMNVPKDLYNSFGKYYYRNAETILETAKPICAKYRATLTVEDEIIYIHGTSYERVMDEGRDITRERTADGRFYVKAVATLHDWDSTEKVQNHAFAREEENKKGMDASQVTGSCSSYARKYALNGLFNLDDVKDADSNEQKQETDAKAKGKAEVKEQAKVKTQSNEQKPTAQVILATQKQIGLIVNMYAKNELNAMLKRLNKKNLTELTIEEASTMIKARGGE